MAELAIVERRDDDAAAVLAPLVATDAKDAVALYDLALVRQHHGDYDRAHQVEKLRASFPDDARGPELERRIGGIGAAGPSGAAPASASSSPPSRRRDGTIFAVRRPTTQGACANLAHSRSFGAPPLPQPPARFEHKLLS